MTNGDGEMGERTRRGAGLMAMIQQLPAPQVSQRHLSEVYSAQKSLAAAFLCWQRTRSEACWEFSKSNSALHHLRPLYLQSLTLLQFVRDVESRHERLRQTLDQCNGRAEPGILYVDLSAFLVRRKDGNDEYPLTSSLLEPDTIITIQDASGCCTWVNKNYEDVFGQPISEVIGKRADQIWRTAGREIALHDHDVLKRGPVLFRETLRVSGRTLDRFAVRFPLPAELRDCGSIAKIDFDAAGALRYAEPRTTENSGQYSDGLESEDASSRVTRADASVRHGSDTHTSRSQAAIAIRLLQQLGRTIRDIARASATPEGSIRRILSPRPYSPRAAVVESIQALVRRTVREQFALMAQHLQIEVLETCNHKGIVLDEELRSEIQRVLRESIVSTIEPGKSSPNLPTGIDAAIATLGGGMYLIKIGDGHGDVQKTQILIHELQDLIDQLRRSAPKSTRVRPTKSAF